MTTSPPPRNPRPRSRLVQHDIRLRREPSDQERSHVVASVKCERFDCDMLVEVCARCERFAHIETHEAGYVLLCRAHAQGVVSADAERPAEPDDP